LKKKERKKKERQTCGSKKKIRKKETEKKGTNGTQKCIQQAIQSKLASALHY
jgi:hypothetical protein